LGSDGGRKLYGCCITGIKDIKKYPRIYRMLKITVNKRHF